MPMRMCGLFFAPWFTFALFPPADIVLIPRARHVFPGMTGSGYAGRLRQQAGQDVPGHQGVRGPQPVLQRDAQTQQAGFTG